MQKTILVEITEPWLLLDTDIAFSLVPGWSGVATKTLSMSLLRPVHVSEKTFPCILWICGGAWLSMDRNIHLANFSGLAKKGFVIASVEYRTSNEAKFPAQLVDIKSAIRFLRVNAKRFRIDPDKIGVMGESAGGHLACLAGTTGDQRDFDLGKDLEVSSAVQSVCAWYPPIDLEFSGSSVEGVDPFFGMPPQDLLLGTSTMTNPEAAKVANPASYISSSTPPFLLLHGNQDKLVPMEHSKRLHDVLEKKGVPVEFFVIEGATHASHEFFQPKVMEILHRHFESTLLSLPRKTI